MPDTEMQIGAQSRAANVVVSGIPELTAVVSDLGESLQSAITGFRGGASAAFVEAVTAWFEVAQDLAPALASYADRLVATDQAAAATESQEQARFARLADRLGGPS